MALRSRDQFEGSDWSIHFPTLLRPPPTPPPTPPLPPPPISIWWRVCHQRGLPHLVFACLSLLKPYHWDVYLSFFYFVKQISWIKKSLFPKIQLHDQHFLDLYWKSKSSQVIYTDKQFQPCVLLEGIYWNRLRKNEPELEVACLTWPKKGIF